MDDVLPSYLQATTKDHWAIISSFVRSRDLCTAALVSKRWNEIFMPRLWGNPASHFGTQNDAVYVALVRFKRTLSWARLSTRELTHTVHLPPAHAEIYDGPHADWLRELLERLPKLQSLIVKGLPFFDHGALATLKHSSRPRTPREPDEPEPIPVYNLRLLDASYCLNTTSPGLTEAFNHFPALTYLDISGTYPAKNRAVLSNLRHMPQLQILKARALSLKDDDIDVLAGAVGCSVRSLDLRDNYLTDHSVRILLERCFKGPKEATRLQRRMMATVTGDWPSTLRPQHGVELLEAFKSDRQDEYVREGLTTGFVSYLGFEHACGTGITHLYISGNRLTTEGISGLVRSRRLHVLDAGTVLSTLKPQELAVRNGQPYTIMLPGAEKLIPVLQSHGQGLTYLRINHAVVTKDVPSNDGNLAELEDTSGIVLPPHLTELDAAEQEVHEMPRDHLQELPAADVVVAELEGSPVPSSAIHDVEHIKEEPLQHAPNGEPPQSDGVRRGSIFAPEVVETENTPILTATGGAPLSPSGPALPSIVSPLSSHFQTTNTPSTAHLTLPPSPSFPSSPTHLTVPTPHPPRKRSYSTIQSAHAAHTAYLQSNPHALLPHMLPALQTLVLTDVPGAAPAAAASRLAAHLTGFVAACAAEARWARLRADVAYAFPPARSLRDRRAVQTRYARALFALRRVVLEVAPPSPAQAKGRGWRGAGPASPGAAGVSSVEDPDCETFWSAARHDFSFFGGEECGQPDVVDVGAPVPEEKMVVVPGEAEGAGPDGAASMARWDGTDGGLRARGAEEKDKMVDVLAELARFRRAKRERYAAVLAAGGTRDDADEDFVEGYWDGEIVVLEC